MAYRLIASTETDPGAPGTSALFKALDENVAATAEGAAGAARLRGLAAMAISDYALISPIASTAGGVTIPSYTYTGTIVGLITTSATFVVACAITFTARVTGTCTFVGTAIYSGISNVNTEVRLLKNGVQIALASSTGSASVTFTVDSAVSSGDVFTWEVRKKSGTQGAGGSFGVSGTFDPIVTIGLPLKQSEVLP